MRMVIVPNVLRDAINAKLDAAIEACPGAADDREIYFHDLLAYFNKHGELPNFDLLPTTRVVPQSECERAAANLEEVSHD